MRKGISIIAAALAGMAVATLLDVDPWASAQQRQEPRFASIPAERGGQDTFGAYEPVVGWPKDLTTLPGHEGWTFGAGQSLAVAGGL